MLKGALALFLALVLLSFPLTGIAEEEMLRVELVALNVGKADAIVAFVGDKTYLIDAGTKKGYDRLEAALDELGVTRLDGVFLTHTDKDHGGGLKKLAESDIGIGAFYASSIFCEKSPDKHQAVRAAKERGTEVQWLNAGDVVDIAPDCRFEVLSPLVPDEDCENNNSLVMRLVTPEGTALLTGDMEWDAERLLLSSGVELKSDVLKVAHHGRDDATGEAFARAVSPQIALISTDSAEEPRSPAMAVLAALEDSEVYVTEDFDLGIRVRLEGGKATLIED